MASTTKTVTVPVTPPASRGSSDSWSLVTSPASQTQAAAVAAAAPLTSPTAAASEAPSNDFIDLDLAYHFSNMGVPNHQSWARKFYNAGYVDMDDVGRASLDAVFAELRVPSGIQNKLRDGVEKFKAGTLLATSMPQGDLDATAPMQSEGINWAFWGKVVGTVALVAAGGAVATQGRAVALEAITAGAAGVAAPQAAAAMVVGLGDCLDGEMLVTMADRCKKKIKDVKVGDKILSYNKGKLRVKTVVELKEGSSSTMRELLFQATDGKKFNIKATGGHPFYTKEKDWAVTSPHEAHFTSSQPVKKQKLSVGDTCVLRSGAGAKLMKIGDALPRQKTYNLAIDGPGTFFVEGILSHSGLPTKK